MPKLFIWAPKVAWECREDNVARALAAMRGAAPYATVRLAFALREARAATTGVAIIAMVAAIFWDKVRVKGVWKCNAAARSVLLGGLRVIGFWATDGSGAFDFG
eukprot:1193272-Prorocentrum_minimum.AAC.4